MTKYLIVSFIAIFLILLTAFQISSNTTGIREELIKIIKEEYKVVRRMRHQLRYLLERQDTENTLQEGEDVFQDLQQLEQWLEQMKQDGGNNKVESLLKMLVYMEGRLNRNLTAQEEAGRWLENQTLEEKKVQISLSLLMETFRELIRSRQFDKALKLLDQLQSSLARNQQSLEKAFASENRERFSQSRQQLNKMLSKTQMALAKEKKVQSLLKPFTSQKIISRKTEKESLHLQSQVSKLIGQLQSGMQQFPDSSLFNTKLSIRELKMSQKLSQNTEIYLEESLTIPAFKSSQNTQKSLERLNQNLQKLQQQVQQMSQSRMMARSQGQGQKRYWSEKGVRPMKFEYEFKANPLFREQIQQLKSIEVQGRTPLQQQYLKEVMR